MTPRSAPLAIDPGLLARYREAGGRIAWRAAPRSPKRPAGRTARIAHLNDEEARVERWGSGARTGIAADSGPVGALVVLLEIDQRGAPTLLGAQDAGRDPAFATGALVAAWGPSSVPCDSRPTVDDLVQLARYALA
jgi:hypothetical protein